MNSQHFVRLGAPLCVLIVVVLLLAGALYGSNFVRGLYTLPPLSQPAAWNEMLDIGVTHVRNGRSTFLNTQLIEYRNLLNSLGLKAILEKGWWHWPASTPYLLTHYSLGQYKEFRVEWDPTLAQYWLNFDGTGYYYFQQNTGYFDPTYQAWYVQPGIHTPGEILKGPFDTAIPAEGYILENEPEFKFYPAYEYTQRTFRQRVRARADLAGHSPNEVVFKAYLDFERINRSISSNVDSMIVTVASFQQSLQFDTLEFDQTLTTADSVRGFGYRIYWPGTVKLWIDWVAYMDMDQAYHLFADSATQHTALQAIGTECDSVELIMGDVLARWGQSDEPQRSSFTPHGVVNDYMQNQGMKWAQCPQYPNPNRNFKHFVTAAKVPILEVDHYVFKGAGYGGFLGNQTELTALSCSLEVAYQAAQMGSIPLAFTAQAHKQISKNYAGVWVETNRHPCRSEILAEAYIGLAHGATEIYFYRYTSGESSTSKSYGLVTLAPEYSHAEEPYASKWQAVKDVFTQLNAFGDILLTLDRDTAFCVSQVTAAAYQSPVAEVYFEDDNDDYIEVGQFHLSSDPTQKYLILVNRRTNYDRRITVKTSLSGHWAMHDLYTNEKYLSSTGDFYGVPFDSGEGRVFKFEPFVPYDQYWLPNDHYVLADTFRVGLDTTLCIYTDVQATSGGFLYVLGNLNCVGGVSDTVRFTPAENTSQWKGIEISNACTKCHYHNLIRAEIRYGRISNANIGLKVVGRTGTSVQNSRIDHCDYGYSGVNGQTNLKYSDVTDCDYALTLANCSDLLYYLNVKANALFEDYVPAIMMEGDVGIPLIGHSEIMDNGAEGIQNWGADAIMLYDPTNYPLCGYNDIVGNNVLYDNNETGGLCNYLGAPQLGIGSTWGYNSIYGNGLIPGSTRTEHHIHTDVNISAEHNYWGDAGPGYPTPYNFTGSGNVDWIPFLWDPPGDGMMGNPGVAGRRERSGGADSLGNPWGSSLAYALICTGDSLFLAGSYSQAIQTYLQVISQFTQTSSALYALPHLKDCYVMMEDFTALTLQLAVLDSIQSNPALVNLAAYLSIDALAADSLGLQAIALANNVQIVSAWPAPMQQSALLKTGFIKKYNLDDYQAGQQVFQQFLTLYPQSPLAQIAAMELGVEWESRGTSGSGAQGGIMVADLPAEFRLYPNHPNPFNAATILRFELPEASRVSLVIFDISGRQVAALVDGFRDAGVHEVSWDAAELPSGIYCARLDAGSRSAVQKVVLLK